VFHGHGGDGDGYLAHYAYNRNSGLGYFIVINAFNNRGLYKMRMLLEDYITDTNNIKTAIKLRSYQHKNLEQFTGTYKSVTYRMPWVGIDTTLMMIYIENKKLFYKYNNVIKELISINEFHFRLKN